MTRISVLLPACNEALNIGRTVSEVRTVLPDAEILVIDDGSTDDTARIAADGGATVVSHPYRMGNGASVKTGIRKARCRLLCILDGDGQHPPNRILDLVEGLSRYAMVVGARETYEERIWYRNGANVIFNGLASFLTGIRIPDLTSGFRVLPRTLALRFLYLLPNGFSSPTTLTMALLKSGYPVGWVPVHCRRRQGQSKVRLLHDGVQFLVVIFKLVVLFSPLKVFVPASLMLFLAGIAYWLYTYLTLGVWTKLAFFFLIASVIVFCIGLLSEQITLLAFARLPEIAGEDEEDAKKETVSTQ